MKPKLIRLCPSLMHFRAGDVLVVVTLSLEEEEGKPRLWERSEGERTVRPGSRRRRGREGEQPRGIQSGSHAALLLLQPRLGILARRQRHRAGKSVGLSLCLEPERLPEPAIPPPQWDAGGNSACVGRGTDRVPSLPLCGESGAHAAGTRGGAVPVPPPRHSPRGGRAPGA